MQAAETPGVIVEPPKTIAKSAATRPQWLCLLPRLTMLSAPPDDRYPPAAPIEKPITLGS
jgi:hypothetical protein